MRNLVILDSNRDCDKRWLGFLRVVLERGWVEGYIRVEIWI